MHFIVLRTLPICQDQGLLPLPVLLSYGIYIFIIRYPSGLTGGIASHTSKDDDVSSRLPEHSSLHFNLHYSRCRALDLYSI